MNIYFKQLLIQLGIHAIPKHLPGDPKYKTGYCRGTTPGHTSHNKDNSDLQFQMNNFSFYGKGPMPPVWRIWAIKVKLQYNFEKLLHWCSYVLWYSVALGLPGNAFSCSLHVRSSIVSIGKGKLEYRDTCPLWQTLFIHPSIHPLSGSSQQNIASC